MDPWLRASDGFILRCEFECTSTEHIAYVKAITSLINHHVVEPLKWTLTRVLPLLIQQ